MKLLYRLGIFFYGCMLRAAALTGHEKARKWVQGRRQWHVQLQNALSSRTPQKLVWMHCASLGEFEQGRPVAEALKQQYPNIQIAISFFSPSGYEVQRNYKGADFTFYLPEDGPENARKLLSVLNPALVIMIKYEFWFYYLKETKNRQIPLLLVSGIFRQTQPFFRWYGGMHRQMLGFFTHLFVQNHLSAALLAQIGIQNATISGDTRFDRVLRILQDQWAHNGIEQWINGRKTIVAGSTWPTDELLLAEAAKALPSLAFIIVPHNVDEASINATKTIFTEAQLYSSLSAKASSQVLVIDAIGMLSKVYRYAYATYVGGGLGKTGLHNVLEPAVYGKPVFHGPQFAKFQEAVGLQNAGGSMVVRRAADVVNALENWLANGEKYQAQAVAAAQYVQSMAGATPKVVQYIDTQKWLA